MADERAGTREPDVRRKYSWLELLRTFLIALDPFKLLIAAAGILVTAFGWWLFSVIYFGMWSEPKGYNDINPKAREAEIEERKKALIKDGVEEVAADEKANSDYLSDGRRFELMRGLSGPGGRYRTMPWFQDRGRNPYLVATDVVSGSRADQSAAVGSVIKQAPVILEPLVKFLGPVYLLFDPNAGFWICAYLFIIIVWMLAVWAFFGGIITRIAAVQFGGKDRISLKQAFRFVANRYLSYLLSPLVPLIIIAVIVFIMSLYGAVALIPILGDIVLFGIGFPLIILGGIVIAILLIGLVGYPMMYTTISTEGSDTFDALSRSYNYVFQAPWQYLWYSIVAVVYGAAVTFLVIVVGCLMVYLGKWAVSQPSSAMATSRKPDFLFVYSPKSLGWQELMLKGSPAEVEPGYVVDEKANTIRKDYVPSNPQADKAYRDDMTWWNEAGAGMVTFWMVLVFLLMIGFSYSYFWSASTMIYLLMRKKVDEVELDEVYIEEQPAPALAPPPPPVSTGPVGSVSLPTVPPPPPPAFTPATPVPPILPPPAPALSPAEEAPQPPVPPMIATAPPIV